MCFQKTFETPKTFEIFKIFQIPKSTAHLEAQRKSDQWRLRIRDINNMLQVGQRWPSGLRRQFLIVDEVVGSKLEKKKKKKNMLQQS